MHPSLAPFAHLISRVDVGSDAVNATMFIKLNKGLASMGSPLIVCKSIKAAVERLEMVRPV